jgi:hypothetical protein
MTNMTLDPTSQLTVVNTQLAERRRDAANARLGTAARAMAQAHRVAAVLRHTSPPERPRISRVSHAASGRG